MFTIKDLKYIQKKGKKLDDTKMRNHLEKICESVHILSDDFEKAIEVKLNDNFLKSIEFEQHIKDGLTHTSTNSYQ